jgi:outer membrane lipoprotein-sorting protein
MVLADRVLPFKNDVAAGNNHIPRATQGDLMSVRKSLSAGCAAVVLSSLAGAAFAADDPGAIMTKMARNYQNAKAYSAVIVTVQKGKTKDGKQFSITKTQNIKFKAPNLVKVAVTFTGTGAAAGQVTQGNQTVVADGKILNAYSPVKNVYMKKPDLPTVNVTDLLDILKRLPIQGGKNVSVLAPTSMDGRACFVIEIRPMMPANLTPDQQAQWKAAAAKANPLHLIIDKQNYLLRKITEVASLGSVDVDLKDQLLNGVIPNSEFSFVPPAGAKEVTQPAAPAGGSPTGPLQPGAPRK